MTLTSTADPAPAPTTINAFPSRPRHGWLVDPSLLLASLALMLLFLGTPPVQRTQEARVLQTAREMARSADARDWLIPRLNGKVRLEKPPLAYWLAAAAYRAGGVNETAGRAPFALAGWGTLVLTALAARRAFGRAAGFYAAAALLGFLMFARHARLAETDVLATLFVTAAILCIARGTRGAMALSGAMIGLAVMSKGPPALFPVLFLIALAAAERDWRLLGRWTLSGAPLIAAAVAAPWFAYVIRAVGYETFRHELTVSVGGGGHAASFLQYFPDLLRATAPWVALVALSLVVAGQRWKDDRSLRVALLWFASVLIPLLIAGQRQYHYLLPAMPPLAVLAARLVASAIEQHDKHRPLVRAILIATLIVMLLGALGLPLLGRHVRGEASTIDAIHAAGGVAGIAFVMLNHARPARFAGAFSAVTAVAVTLLTQAWMPSLRPDNSRAIAGEIRNRVAGALGSAMATTTTVSAAAGPTFAFYGPNISLPLLFYLQDPMPQYETPEAVAAAATAAAGAGDGSTRPLVLIAQTKSGRLPPPVPVGFHLLVRLTSGDQVFEVYAQSA